MKIINTPKILREKSEDDGIDAFLEPIENAIKKVKEDIIEIQGDEREFKNYFLNSNFKGKGVIITKFRFVKKRNFFKLLYITKTLREMVKSQPQRKRKEV